MIYFHKANLAETTGSAEEKKLYLQLDIEESLQSPRKYLLSHYRPFKYSVLNCREIVPRVITFTFYLRYYICIYYYIAKIVGYN